MTDQEIKDILTAADREHVDILGSILRANQELPHLLDLVEQTIGDPKGKGCVYQFDTRLLFVASGLSGSAWGTYWKSDKGGLHRFKSPSMPVVETRDLAQVNLDAWAKKMGISKVINTQ